jgi:hypothetical protein
MYVRDYKKYLAEKNKKEKLVTPRRKKKKPHIHNTTNDEIRLLITNSRLEISYKELKRLCFYANNLKYSDFLETEYWKAVRRLVIERDRYRCVVCGSKKRLTVHHLTYKNHFKEHENLCYLTTVCHDCHHEYHATVFDFIQNEI